MFYEFEWSLFCFGVGGDFFMMRFDFEFDL